MAIMVKMGNHMCVLRIIPKTFINDPFLLDVYQIRI